MNFCILDDVYVPEINAAFRGLAVYKYLRDRNIKDEDYLIFEDSGDYLYWQKNRIIFCDANVGLLVNHIELAKIKFGLKNDPAMKERKITRDQVESILEILGLKLGCMHCHYHMDNRKEFPCTLCDDCNLIEFKYEFLNAIDNVIDKV